MIPGEYFIDDGDICINENKKVTTLVVANSGDRPIQVGSHYHFYETNNALLFDRGTTKGFRLNIAAGTAIRFEPGQEREVELVEYAGLQQIYGFNAKVMGPINKVNAEDQI